MDKAFRKILIPIDFTINSLNAVKKACETADKNATLYLLYVQCYGYPLLSFSAARFLRPDEKKDYEEAARKLHELRKWVTDNFPNLGVTIQIDTIRDVEHGIIHAAKTIGVNLIIIATRSTHRWLPFLKTVRPEKIQKTTSVPVMIVKAGISERTPQSILVPVDDGLNEHKLEVVKCLCKNYDATIYLLKFLDETISDKSQEAMVRLQYLQRLRENIHCSVKWQLIKSERNGHSIRKIAEGFNPDLLILQSGNETKMNSLNGQIFDYFSHRSPIQIILTN